MSAHSVSGSANSSSFSCSSCLDSCARSLPLKIASCIPIIGMATSVFAFLYSRNAIKQIYHPELAFHEEFRNQENTKLQQAIEWIQIQRDHCLASGIRQVANIALIVLGITAGGALSIGVSIGIGAFWVYASRWLDARIQEISINPNSTNIVFDSLVGRTFG